MHYASKSNPLLVAFAVLMFAWMSWCRTWGDDAARLDNVVETYKRQYRFNDWAGKAKKQGRISSVGFLPNDLRLLFDIKVTTATSERDLHLSISLVETPNASGASINVGVHPTVINAQEAPFREFVAHSALPRYVKAEAGTNFDVGDTCLFSLSERPPAGIAKIAARPFLGSVYFSRNNVSVRILNNCEKGKEYADVLFVAKVLDRLLCNHIVEDASGAKPGPG